MIPKKATSKSSTRSDTYPKLVTRKHSKEIIQEQGQDSVIAQSILKQLMESLKPGILIKENHLNDNSDFVS
ncbi:ty3-gypsy retrotransposon protein [Cucumis melo var. makuwa]|uniref:Ty3-gypsy retrotransposon protein n=1 Tax=Cucumis melo var. makuwa TaxID=1194695 RepID=A0A5D3DJV9_CUCMM|nr:ty3-gypsy retrotransposon protein [Cucumis melo var. makuwa]